MGCDWMSCGNCGRAFNWTFADCCNRCDNDDNFICDRCCKCCECGRSEYDNITDSELTEREKPLIDAFKLMDVKDNMTDEELLKEKINEIRQVNSNYKVLLNTLETEKNDIAYRIRKKIEESKKVKEIEELKIQKELSIKKLEKELE